MTKFLVQKHFMFTVKQPRMHGIKNVSRIQILSTCIMKLANASPVTADKCRTDSLTL
jgi:hypothetical protein